MKFRTSIAALALSVSIATPAVVMLTGTSAHAASIPGCNVPVRSNAYFPAGEAFGLHAYFANGKYFALICGTHQLYVYDKGWHLWHSGVVDLVVWETREGPSVTVQIGGSTYYGIYGQRMKKVF